MMNNIKPKYYNIILEKDIEQKHISDLHLSFLMLKKHESAYQKCR